MAEIVRVVWYFDHILMQKAPVYNNNSLYIVDSTCCFCYNEQL